MSIAVFFCIPGISVCVASQVRFCVKKTFHLHLRYWLYLSILRVAVHFCGPSSKGVLTSSFRAEEDLPPGRQ